MTPERLWKLLEILDSERIVCHLSYKRCWEEFRSLAWQQYQESVDYRDVFPKEAVKAEG